jgi:molybdopterin/thiamine biosynthesis adenylyltransferase
VSLTDRQLERYSRQIILKEIGPRGQKALLSARVLIIGAGGLGSPAAMYLAAAGVGTLGLTDGDAVDLTNLQRQILHATPDLGRPKTESALETLAALNPDVKVITNSVKASAENILELISGYDFIIDGTDNFSAKFLINDACVIGKKPFTHAGILRFSGQLMTYVPGAGPCYRCLFVAPPPPDTVPTCRQAGVIGALAGVIGCLEAMEAIKYLTGTGSLLTGSLLTYDALKTEFRKIAVPIRHNCAVCGKEPTIKTPTDYESAQCDVKF